jgi:hypothetical protein
VYIRAGVLIEQTEQPFLDLSFDSPLEQLSATAVRYLIAVGPQAGRATMRLHDPSAVDDSPQSTKPFTAARDGFSVNCAVACEAHERAKLERGCRYMARPPVAEDRLSVDGDGLVIYELKVPVSSCCIRYCTLWCNIKKNKLMMSDFAGSDPG